MNSCIFYNVKHCNHGCYNRQKYEGQSYTIKQFGNFLVKCKNITIFIETDKLVYINNIKNGIVCKDGKLIAAFGTAVTAHRRSEFGYTDVEISQNTDYKFKHRSVICNAQMFKNLGGHWKEVFFTGRGICEIYVFNPFIIHSKDAVFNIKHFVNVEFVAMSKIKIHNTVGRNEILAIRDRKCKFVNQYPKEFTAGLCY